MFRCVIIAFCVQFLAAIWYSLQPTADSGMSSADFVFEPATLDIGNLECGTTWRGTVNLRNQGVAKGTVKNISTSCGCTAADVESGDDFKPGEVRAVAVSLQVGEHRDVRREVTILCEFESNQTMKGVATATISGTARCDKAAKCIDTLIPLTPSPDPLFTERVSP